MRSAAPNSVEAAIDLLAATEGAYVLAGGTDLLVKLRAEILEPELVVDIKRISGMKGITPEDGGWRIGAAVSGAERGEQAVFFR